MARILISFGTILLLWFLLVENWMTSTMTDEAITGIMIIAFIVAVGMVALGNGIQMWVTKD